MKNYPPDYLRKVAREIFEACGAPAPSAELVAEHLVSANLAGADSHGVIRVPQYVHDIREGVILPCASITLQRETATMAIVDAGWNFGQVGALRAVEVAMDKAQGQGLGCAVLRRCRHVGCLGAYPRLAAEQGFVAIAMCGSAGEGHWVAPWGGREGRLSTNPIAFAAPTGGNPIVLDFSTSMASEGKVRLMRNREQPLPEGWIVDNNGSPTTDPNELYRTPKGAILPFGGAQGYKGYALSLMAQIMSSLLGKPAWMEQGVESNANNLWLQVIDIRAFMSLDDFRREVDDLIRYIKSSALAKGFDEILMPGEPEFREMEKRKINGIPIDRQTWRQIEELAQELGVDLRMT